MPADGADHFKPRQKRSRAVRGEQKLQQRVTAADIRRAHTRAPFVINTGQRFGKSIYLNFNTFRAFFNSFNRIFIINYAVIYGGNVIFCIFDFLLAKRKLLLQVCDLLFQQVAVILGAVFFVFQFV